MQNGFDMDIAAGAWPGQSGRRLGGHACWQRRMELLWWRWWFAGAAWIGGKQKGAADPAHILSLSKTTFII
eukprot:560702-Prorocentrum_lima.AAC.1